MDPKCHVLIGPIWHIGKKLNTLYVLNLKWNAVEREKYFFSIWKANSSINH